MNFHKPNLKLNFKTNLVGKIILGVIGIYVLYVLAIGLISSTCPEHYTAPDLGDNATDKDKAMIMADAVTHSLDTELDSVFGWIPNDLLFVPKILDNITSYQKGVIYATRPASDIVAKTVSRYGKMTLWILVLWMRLHVTLYTQVKYGDSGLYTMQRENTRKVSATGSLGLPL